MSQASPRSALPSPTVAMRLRKNPSAAEALLWTELRKLKLAGVGRQAPIGPSCGRLRPPRPRAWPSTSTAAAHRDQRPAPPSRSPARPGCEDAGLSRIRIPSARRATAWPRSSRGSPPRPTASPRPPRRPRIPSPGMLRSNDLHANVGARQADPQGRLARGAGRARCTPSWGRTGRASRRSSYAAERPRGLRGHRRARRTLERRGPAGAGAQRAGRQGRVPVLPVSAGDPGRAGPDLHPHRPQRPAQGARRGRDRRAGLPEAGQARRPRR